MRLANPPLEGRVELALRGARLELKEECMTSVKSKGVFAAGLVALLALFISLCVAQPSTAQAATPSVKTLFSYSYVGGNAAVTKTVKKYDVGGSSKKDTVKFKFDTDRSFSMSINGKRVYYNRDGSMFEKVQLITLKNGKKFIYFYSEGSSTGADSGVYKYSDGELKKVFSGKIAKNLLYCHITSVKVSGNTVKANFAATDARFGLLKFSYSYKYKKGTLKRTSSSTSTVTAYTCAKSDNVYSKGYFTAKHKVKAKASASSKAKTKTIKKGTKVKIVKAKVANKALWLKVKTKGGTTYWVKSADSCSSHSRYFCFK